MPTHTLSITECLSFGWNTFKSRPWFFIGAFLAISAVDILIRVITSHGKGASGMLVLIDFVASVVFGTALNMGVISFLLKAHDTPMTVAFKDFWPDLERFWKYFVAMILTLVVTAAGFILIIIPGLIAMVTLAFTYYEVIEKDLGPIEAMKASARITKGHRWHILGLFIVLILINIAGLIALVVGLLVSMPVTMFAVVHAYRLLSKASALPQSEPAPVV